MSIEAMKQALDALEYLATQIKPDYEHSKAIASIRQAIAEAEQLDNLLFQQPMIDLWQRYCDKKKEIDELKEKLAEAEKQEPAVYIPADALRQITPPLLILRGVSLYGYRGDGLTPLYTHPQPKRECDMGVMCIECPDAQPKREPLTDEQILADETLRYHFGMNGGAGPVSRKGRAVIAAIEAAHGIKAD